MTSFKALWVSESSPGVFDQAVVERRIDDLRQQQGQIRNAIAAVSIAQPGGAFDAAIERLRIELRSAGVKLGLAAPRGNERMHTEP